MQIQNDMITFIIISAILIIGLRAALGRAIGAEWGFNRTAERFLAALAYAWPTALFAGPFAAFGLLSFAGIATGHGQYFLNLTKKNIEPEKVDFMVSLFFGKDPRTDISGKSLKGAAQIAWANKRIQGYGEHKLYWRCVAGMFAKGLVTALPCVVLAVCFSHYIVAGLFMLTAPFQALSYVIGYKWFSEGSDRGTVAAEWINGGLAGVVIVAVLGVLL